MFIIIFLGSLSPAWGADYPGSYNGSIVLPCGHNQMPAPYVRWYYKDKYDGNIEKNVVVDIGGGNPSYGPGFDGRVQLDYDSGNITITNLGCQDDQDDYTCFVGSVIAVHDVILSKSHAVIKIF